jgi:O-antigen ligase
MLPAGTATAPIATRAVWRPPAYAWVLLGGVALAMLHKTSPERFEGRGLLLTPLLVVGGVFVIWRLWESPPAVTVCAAIALRIFSGAWSQIGLGGVPLDRLLILLALAQVFLHSPGAAHIPALRLRNVHLLMIATVLYLVVSAAMAGTVTSAFSVQAVIDEFGIAPYLGFLIATAVFCGERERGWLLATLVGLGLYLGITAVFEALGPHSLVFPSYIAHIDAADPSGRVNGPFQGSVAEGCAAFACAVAALIAFQRWRGLNRRYLAGAAALLCLFACFATLERGVWIATVAAALITALTSRQTRRWILPGAAICAVLVGALLIGSSTLSSKATTRVNDQRSIWDRKNQTAAGLRMIEARPLLGFGLDRYKSDSLDYFRQASDYPMTGRVALDLIGEPETVQPLHNLYLSYGVELGLVGGLLWLATLLCGVGAAVLSAGPVALHPWKRGLLAIASFFLIVTFVNPQQPPFAVLLLWTWAGVALVGAPAAGAVPRRARPPVAAAPALASG